MIEQNALYLKSIGGVNFIKAMTMRAPPIMMPPATQMKYPINPSYNDPLRIMSANRVARLPTWVAQCDSSIPDAAAG